MCTLSDEKFALLIDKLSDRYDTDTVLQLILALNDEKIEKNWVILNLEKFVEGIEKCGYDPTGSKYIRLLREKRNGLSEEKFTEIGLFADKLRVLYNMTPQWSTLEPAVDAATDYSLEDGIANVAGKKTRIVVGLKIPSVSEMVLRDRDNFISLLSQLSEKYRQRGKGLDELFSMQ